MKASFICNVLGYFQTKIVSENILVKNISIDSRTFQEGDCFFAIKGERTDGHLFIKDVIEKKPSVIVYEKKREKDLSLILNKFSEQIIFISVNNSKDALIKIASEWRKKFTIPIIAITGSVGKTTTKELISSMFSLGGFSVIYSKGNLNSDFGVALSLLTIRSFHQIGVFEAGISKIGDMDILGDMIRPTAVVITQISDAHLSGLKNIEIILKEKIKLCDYISSQGLIFLNGKNSLLQSDFVKKKLFFNQIYYSGIQNNNSVWIDKSNIIFNKNNRPEFDLYVKGDLIKCSFYVFHYGLFELIEITVLLGIFFKIDILLIIESILSFLPYPNRYYIKRIGEARVIFDAYNANLMSMISAITSFLEICNKNKFKKILILGSMLDLEKQSYKEHRKLILFLILNQKKIEKIILVGEDIRRVNLVKKLKNVKLLLDYKEAENLFNSLIKEKVDILIKGSNGINLWKIGEKYIAEE